MKGKIQTTWNLGLLYFSMDDPKFFEVGLKMIESDIIELEKLTKK
jgi:hypothetical protein